MQFLTVDASLRMRCTRSRCPEVAPAAALGAVHGPEPTTAAESTAPVSCCSRLRSTTTTVAQPGAAGGVGRATRNRRRPALIAAPVSLDTLRRPVPLLRSVAVRRRCGPAQPRPALADCRGVSGRGFDAAPACGRASQALGFQVLRWLGRCRGPAPRNSPSARRRRRPMRCCAARWRLPPDGASRALRPLTLVDQAVEAAKRRGRRAAQASFINACLRRFLRERDELVAATDADPVAHWNHPRWWIERAAARPSARLAARAASRQRAGADDAAREPARRTSLADYLQRCRQPASHAHPVGATAVCAAAPRPVQRSARLCRGRVLGAGRGRPAGRAAAAGDRPAPAGRHAAARARRLRRARRQDRAPARAATDCDVTALDIDAARCERIDETLARLGLQANVVAGDRRRRAADELVGWRALRRDPARRALHRVGHRAPPSRRALAAPRERHRAAGAHAGRLLAALWPLLAAGGRLLYCTCSVFRAEGADQIDAFLAHNTDARLLPAPGHLLPRAGHLGP